MERSSADERGRGRRLAVALTLVVLLLGAVAIASRGGTPVGGGGVRRPSDQLLDVVLSLTLVVLVVAAPVVLVLMFFRRHAQEEIRRMTGGRKRGPLATLGSIVAAGALILVAILVVRNRNRSEGEVIGRPNTSTSPGDTTPAEEAYSPEFATWPVAVVLAVLVLAAIAGYLTYRARRKAPGDRQKPVALVLAEVLEETLDDLRREADPRRAVIAAYARLERTLAAYGLPRHPAEAPDEYVARILGDLEVGRRSVERLTGLFARAKFSTHDVDTQTKEEAIDALETVRAELRDAEIRAAAAQEAAAAEARERAATT
jgi:heme/copper-type cytochrome/quinol oxidase subunit 2